MFFSFFEILYSDVSIINLNYFKTDTYKSTKTIAKAYTGRIISCLTAFFSAEIHLLLLSLF
jgi:hypothetical protein